MFKFFHRNLLHLKSNVRTSRIHKLTRFQLNPLSTTSARTSESIAIQSEKRLFTADYLVQKCGFSREKAVSASKKFIFQTSEQPDSVVSFLEDLKFTKSQIFKTLKSRPTILLGDPEKTFLPKIRYLRALGFSVVDIPRIVSTVPSVLRINLEERLMPSVDYLRGFLESDRKFVNCVKRYPFILCLVLQTSVIRNISMLRELGVSEANVKFLFSYQPRLFASNHEKLKCTVKKVMELGFDPSGVKFSLAVFLMRSLSEFTWGKKVKVYKDWGFSENEIMDAFKRQPWFMSASENKIMALMDFLVNQMGFEHSLLLKAPGIIVLSLQKRIRPRCIIFKELSAKGLVKKNLNLPGILNISEEKFRQRYVEYYKAEAPELLNIYNKYLALSK